MVHKVRHLCACSWYLLVSRGRSDSCVHAHGICLCQGEGQTSVCMFMVFACMFEVKGAGRDEHLKAWSVGELLMGLLILESNEFDTLLQI